MAVLRVVCLILLVLLILLNFGNNTSVRESIAHLCEQVTDQQSVEVSVRVNIQISHVYNKLVVRIPAIWPYISKIGSKQLGNFENRKNWLEFLQCLIFELKCQIILSVDVIIIGVYDRKCAIGGCGHLRYKVQTLNQGKQV